MSIRTWIAAGAVLSGIAAAAQAAPSSYRTALTRWAGRSGGFASWTRSGVELGADGSLVLDPATARPGTDPFPAGGYHGRNFYNGGSFVVGEATSPEIAVTFPLREAIASWNAATPAGTWIETLVRARLGTRWTKWYSLGVWTSEPGAASSHSVNAQRDADGTVSVDTVRIAEPKTDPASAYQVKVRLFSAEAGTVPMVSGAAAIVSTAPTRPRDLAAGDPARWGNVLPVPACSQMVYPDGGTVWCSPTAVAMVLAYWEQAPAPCEPRVRGAVAGVHDWLFKGHGNWPFNTAYASAQGYEAFVGRLTSLAEAERWIAAGVPLVISFAWGNGELAGAAISASNGHLALLVGFDAGGNPVVNDPAAPGDADVRRTYARAELEALWLEHSGGTVYAIYPAGTAIPE